MDDVVIYDALRFVGGVNVNAVKCDRDFLICLVEAGSLMFSAEAGVCLRGHALPCGSCLRLFALGDICARFGSATQF